MFLNSLSKPLDSFGIADNRQLYFPFFAERESPVYLDSAATSLKPRVVIDRISKYYSVQSVNIHRSDHTLGLLVSQEYELCRQKVKEFVGGDDSYELVFSSGTTDSLNVIAQTLLATMSSGKVHTGVSAHHSLLLPLRKYSKEYGLQLCIHPCLDSGELDVILLCDKIERGDVLFLCGMSNVTGYKPPLKMIAKRCKELEVPLIVDAGQLIPHEGYSLYEQPVDAIVFSPHKLFGPTGLGVACIKKDLLHKLHPFRVGGGSVTEVTLTDHNYQDGPAAFEAGTPSIASVLGMGAALQFIKDFGVMDTIISHEAALRKQLVEGLLNISHIHILGDTYLSDSAIVSVYSDKYHSQDICFYLNTHNIAARGGFLCAQPYINSFTAKPVVRFSCHIYNTFDDISLLLNALDKL